MNLDLSQLPCPGCRRARARARAAANTYQDERSPLFTQLQVEVALAVGGLHRQRGGRDHVGPQLPLPGGRPGTGDSYADDKIN